MSIYQSNINGIVSSLYHKGLRHVVICPGSRNAPLVMAFARFGKISCYSVPDERVAGFVALGMCKQLREPVAVICTSGTAVLNLYPAVAEAFYMQLPLLLITADRPRELIGRWDGQSIQQFEVFKPHVLGSFETPENLDESLEDAIIRICLEFYEKSDGPVKGPSHLNVPLREPLYEAARLEFEYPLIPLGTTDHAPVSAQGELPDFIGIQPGKKIMILLGAEYAYGSDENLRSIAEKRQAVVISDVTSNAHSLQNISNWESVLLNASEEQKAELAPDILITAGKMVLNKTIKQLLRKHAPAQHWHIAENGFSADTFFTDPDIIDQSPLMVFGQLSTVLNSWPMDYFEQFDTLSVSQRRAYPLILQQDFNEFAAIRQVLQALPGEIVLHLANSMSVRYVAYLADYLKPGWKLFANRGVSGIDGCSSTAVGMSLVNNDLNILITGDIAFYYDINALWQQRLPENLRIILLNNFGGGIFKNIDGPADLPELDPFIGTPHQLKAGHIAAHFGLRYYLASNDADLQRYLPEFLDGPGMAILEITTDQELNSKIFKQYKSIVL